MDDIINFLDAKHKKYFLELGVSDELATKAAESGYADVLKKEMAETSFSLACVKEIAEREGCENFGEWFFYDRGIDSYLKWREEKFSKETKKC